MVGAQEHYDAHLAEHYNWIYGGLDHKLTENAEFFDKRGVLPKSTRVALDLGAGSGFQTLPLARRGFHVVAVDFSRQLLAELRDNARNLDVELVEADITNRASYAGKKPELIVCMGDTLTHLPSTKDIESFLDAIVAELVPGGRAFLTFRDLTGELHDGDRFIPVRSEPDRIFTCFLEYSGEHIKVHDIVHTREGAGWRQKISVYRKTRIAPLAVADRLESAGLAIDEFDLTRGLATIGARKPN